MPRRLPVFIFLFFFFPALCLAQDFLDYLGIENGLSNNAVTSIYQDKNGLMWFGTYDGLNLYNGYEFKIFRNKLNDATSLGNNRIVDIAEDGESNVWIGTKGGISIYNPRINVFNDLYFKEGNLKVLKAKMPINELQTDGDGNMLIGTAGSGLLMVPKGERIAIQLPMDNENDKGYHVQAIQIRGNKIFVFVQGRGIYNLEIRTKRFTLITDFVRDAKCLLADADGNLWVGSENGLFRYNWISKKSDTYYESRNGLSNSHIHSLTLDWENRVWVGTDGGGITIFDLRKSLVSHISQGADNGTLKSGAVDAVFFDTDRRTWIGTLRGGINIVDQKKNRFKTISHIPYNKNSLISDFVLSFCQDTDGSVWIGTDGGGVSNWNPRTDKFANYTHHSGNNSLSNNNVSTIARDFKGNIWLGTYGGGINRFDKATNGFVHYSLNNSDYSYPDRNVWALFEDSSHRLWASTLSNGPVYIYNRTLDRFEVFDKDLKDVITFYQDEKQQLWAGTFRSLIKIDPVNKKHRIFNIGFPVRAIVKDQGDGLLLGTEGGGLQMFNRKTEAFTTLSEKDGLPNNAVLNILKDRRGSYWLSTFNGLSEFDPKKRSFKNFYKNDGLQSNQFNYNAALVLSSGELLFGGLKGFNIFDPGNIHFSVTTPKLIITSLKINNQAYEADSSITHKESIYSISELKLPYDKANISFEFAALDYSSPEKKTYAYYLEGWDKGWNYVGTNRSANYSRISEGTYYFRIKTINSEGEWTTKEKVIKVIILPPWYRTIWAYCLYFIALVGLIYGYSYYQRKQVKLKFQVKLANLAVEKEKDLNERKLSFFTHISHEFRTPLTLIINPIKEILNNQAGQVDPRELIVVYRNARRMLSLVDQLLHFRKSAVDQLKVSSFDVVSFSKEVYLCFQQQARIQNIEFDFQSNAERILIYADKEKIEIALFNLLYNAFKYTPAKGSISLLISDIENEVTISVVDTGRGISKDVGEKLFNEFFQVREKQNKTGFGIGLYLVKSFVEAHHGRVHYISEENKGAAFTINLLKGSEHLKSYPITEESDSSSFLLEKLQDVEPPMNEPDMQIGRGEAQLEVLSEKPSVLLVDDNHDIRTYLKKILQHEFVIYEADSGEEALELVQKYIPNIVISDVLMGELSGVDLCRKIKEDAALNHIPVVLLTSSSSAEMKLKGIECGADDFITKPFDKDILLARISNLLKTRNNLQRYFYNHITFKSENLKVSPEYKEFLEKCIRITEKRIDDPTFNIQELADEIGLSHSSLYKRVKSISGKSVSEFIRFIRLRKAAELLINSDYNVSECAFSCGFNDVKYFRVHFNKLYGINPSEYMLKYRKPFQKGARLNKN